MSEFLSNPAENNVNLNIRCFALFCFQNIFYYEGIAKTHKTLSQEMVRLRIYKEKKHTVPRNIIVKNRNEKLATTVGI